MGSSALSPQPETPVMTLVGSSPAKVMPALSREGLVLVAAIIAITIVAAEPYLPGAVEWVH